MNKKNKQLSNPISTGGGGPHFEAHVQASYTVLMLTGGYAPCLPTWPICEIKLQGKKDGYETDDLVLFVEDHISKERRKLLCQIKRKISITKDNTKFSEVIHAAWRDFKNPSLFTKNKDAIALIVGFLSETDYTNVVWLLDQAKATNDTQDLFRRIEKAKFSPPKSQEKLEVFQHHLKQANNNKDISDADIPEVIRNFFKSPKLQYIPEDFSYPTTISDQLVWTEGEGGPAIAIINLIGAWDNANEADVSTINDMLGKL